MSDESPAGRQRTTYFPGCRHHQHIAVPELADRNDIGLDDREQERGSVGHDRSFRKPFRDVPTPAARMPLRLPLCLKPGLELGQGIAAQVVVHFSPPPVHHLVQGLDEAFLRQPRG